MSKGERPRQDWLARALSRSGVMTLSEAEDAIRAGRVSVMGRVVKVPMAMVQPGDEVKVDGHPVALKRQTRVLMFHKPRGVVTERSARGVEDDVFTLLHAQLSEELSTYEWHAVGRLDRNTTGLLLFTNDERFVAHATSPAAKLGKKYVARVQGELNDEKLEPLRRGMTLDDGLARPAKVKIRSAHEVEVVLTEGRNHQVKRMLGAVGLPVNALHREGIGKLLLDVGEGEVRELTADEIRQALNFAG